MVASIWDVTEPGTLSPGSYHLNKTAGWCHPLVCNEVPSTSALQLVHRVAACMLLDEIYHSSVTPILEVLDLLLGCF